MGKWIILILSFLIQFQGFSQQDYTRILVTKDIELIQLSENAFVHVSEADIQGFGRVSSNGLLFTNKGEAFLFDTPVTEAQTKDLVTWITGPMKLKLTGFAPNHWHSDCMGGLGYLQSLKIKSYASEKTIEIAKSRDKGSIWILKR